LLPKNVPGVESASGVPASIGASGSPASAAVASAAVASVPPSMGFGPASGMAAGSRPQAAAPAARNNSQERIAALSASRGGDQPAAQG
jgi:hypothetical protein